MFICLNAKILPPSQPRGRGKEEKKCKQATQKQTGGAMHRNREQGQLPKEYNYKFINTVPLSNEEKGIRKPLHTLSVIYRGPCCLRSAGAGYLTP
jgi:hypothetical protein